MGRIRGDISQPGEHQIPITFICRRDHFKAFGVGDFDVDIFISYKKKAI